MNRQGKRWAEYFVQVLNVADVREANMNVVGNWQMLVLGDLNERAISLDEVGEAVNEMKSGKAPGLDGFPVECPPGGSEWIISVGDYLENSFTALGSSDPREVRLEL